MNCNMRWFRSKPAALVLVWTLCSCTALWSINSTTHNAYHGLKWTGNQSFVLSSAIPAVVIVFAIPFSGWLADSRFGNFKVFKAGSVLLFIGSVLLCLYFLIVTSLDPSYSQAALITSTVLGPLSYLISFTGGSACLVTVFQLGLDQMPDASSTGITSYIAWFSIACYFGFWTSNFLYEIYWHCISRVVGSQVLGLLPVLCMCVILCSIFIAGEKWLIIEPQSPQSLKNIYRVLKFAAKHKNPLNRSAFTYWEDDIPSRIDLGKSRYGGPFTIEQVEDVKTFLRLLVVFIPLWISALSMNVYSSLYLLTNPLELPTTHNSSCVIHMFSKFTYNPWWSGFLTLLIYEIAVYPCLKHRLPTIMRRLGLLLFLATICNIVYSIIGFIHPTGTLPLWSFATYTALSYSLFAFITVCAAEFVCAQSPYNIRGLMSGFVLFTIFLFAFLGYALSLVFTHLCIGKHCSTAQYSIGVGLGIAGFLLHLVVARWYKRRVRDEEYDLYEQVKETFRRYLSYPSH